VRLTAQIHSDRFSKNDFWEVVVVVLLMKGGSINAMVMLLLLLLMLIMLVVMLVVMVRRWATTVCDRGGGIIGVLVGLGILLCAICSMRRLASLEDAKNMIIVLTYYSTF
jgi:hypothetical protein